MTQQDGDLYKLVWGGQLNLNETWSCSLHLASFAPLSTAVAAEGFAAPLIDWMKRPGSKIVQGAFLDFVKFNEVRRVSEGPGKGVGTYVQTNPDTFLIQPAEPTAPTTNVGFHPGQITWAISVHTERSRGRGSIGRFFPPSRVQVNQDGAAGQQDVLDMATSAQELLSEVNAVARGAFPAGPLAPLVSVFSAAGNIAFNVERVSCGRVADTQRRRRSSIPEARVFAPANV